MKEFTISPENDSLYGFRTGDIVKTPKGLAFALGVHGEDLYFWVDGDKGVSKWPGFKDSMFKRRGFEVVYSQSQQANKDRAGSYSAPDLKSLVNEEQFSDVTFVLDDGSKVFASRGILVARSGYFRVMFTSSFAEKVKGAGQEIRLQELDRESLLSILEYLYTGTVQITEQNCAQLLYAADRFMIEPLKQHCATELSLLTTTTNVLQFLLLSDRLNLADLKGFCLEFAAEHIQEPTLRDGLSSTLIDKQHSHLIMEIMDETRKVAFQMGKMGRKRKQPDS